MLRMFAPNFASYRPTRGRKAIRGFRLICVAVVPNWSGSRSTLNLPQARYLALPVISLRSSSGTRSSAERGVTLNSRAIRPADRIGRATTRSASASGPEFEPSAHESPVELTAGDPRFVAFHTGRDALASHRALGLRGQARVGAAQGGTSLALHAVSTNHAMTEGGLQVEVVDAGFSETFRGCVAERLSIWASCHPMRMRTRA